MNKHSRVRLNRWENWIATGLGSGLSPKAPGTVGSVIGLGVWYFLMSPFNFWVELMVIVLVFLLGVYVSRESEKDWTSDHQSIVIDEWVGLWVALLPLNWVGVSQWLWIASAFIMFRFFDILKPGVIRKSEEIPMPGVAVMTDDLLAGAISALLLLGLMKIAL